MAYQRKSSRKFLATSVTAAVVAAAVAPAAGFAAEAKVSFPDVAADHWAADSIAYLVEKGALEGRTDGSFDPTASITRAEAAKILAVSLELEIDEDAKATFADSANHWASKYIAAIQTQTEDVINGFNADEFRPNNKITRQDLAKMVVTAYGLELNEDADVSFTDNTGYASEYVQILASLGVVEGMSAGKFSPQSTVTRAQFPVFVHRTEVENVRVEVPVKTPVVTELAVESVSANNLREVVVTFNQDVDVTSAGTTGNYTFASGSNLSVTNAAVEGNKVTLTVTGASQQQVSDLTVENVKTVSGDLVIGKTTKSVRFVDVTAPTVSSVSAAGPQLLKVVFSEPLQSVPTFSLNEGTIAIVNVDFTPGSREATLTLGTAPEEGTYNLTVKDGSDYAGFKIDEVVKTFNFVVDTTAPKITVKSATPTQVVLTFDEEVTGVNSNNVEFYHTYKGVDAYKAQKSLNGKELTLTFANPLAEGNFTLFLHYVDANGTKIADLWNNKVDAQTITGTVVTDRTAPTVTKVEADSNNAFLVTFSKPVTGATNAANYEIKDAAGNTVLVNGQITNPSGNTYRIPVGTLNGGSYSLSIKNIEDTTINKNKLADFTTTVAVKDLVPPTVKDLDTNAQGTQAQLLSTKKVKIVFSEVMDVASITNKQNYLFGSVALDSKVTITAVDNNQAVILDFTDVASGAQTTPAGSTIKVLRVKDVAGNVIEAPSTDVLVPQNVSAPLFDKAEVTGKNQIKLYFDEVITSAQAADFLVANDGANGTFSAAGSISNTVLDGKSVITLTTTQDLPTTANNVYVKTATTVTAKNSFGTLVSFAATAAEDKYAPLATVAQALDTNSNNRVDSLVITFSEDLYVASVQDTDFTVEGYVITGVSVSGDTVTLSVREKTTNDLSATPKVTLVGTVEDTARNARTGQAAITATSAQAAIDASAQAAVDAEAVKITKSAVEGNGLTTGSNVVTIAQALVAQGFTVTLKSTSNTAIAANGVVTQPAADAQDATGDVVFTVAKDGKSKDVTLNLTVAKVAK